MNIKLIQKIVNLYLTPKIVFLDFHSKTNYIVDNGLFESIQKEIVDKWQIIFYYNKEKFCQKYEISKEFDFNYITPYNFLQHFPIWGPHSASKKIYICIFFVQFLKKKYNLELKIYMNRLL